MNARTRVFVTGASSELMLHVLNQIDSDRYELNCLSRSKSSASALSATWVKGDILDPSSFADHIANADIIIHAAALTHSRTERSYFETNLEGTKSLIRAIPKENNPKFIFISSRVASESSGGYGISKWRAENEVKKLRNWLIIRPAEVFGGSKNEGIDSTIASAIKGGLQPCPMNVPSKMYPVHLLDAANAIYDCSFQSSKQNETVYINGPIGLTFLEVLELVADISGKRQTLIPVPKWLLQIVARISRILPIEIGFVPDQVARLYSPKEHGEACKTTISVRSHIEHLMEKNKH